MRGGVLFRRVPSIVAKPPLLLAAVFPCDCEVETRTETKPHATAVAASGEDRENATENNSEGGRRRRNRRRTVNKIIMPHAYAPNCDVCNCVTLSLYVSLRCFVRSERLFCF
ncbi:hypothetical protein AAHE18_06G194600 [Arachis hypogaea]